MNDLGWTLAWLALQVAALLAPALGLQTLAARRGPQAGAWVATWSLGLVLALSVAACLPGFGSVREVTRAAAGLIPPRAGSVVGSVAAAEQQNSPRATEVGRSLLDWRATWERLGRGVARPVARVRPWGRVVAVVVLTGMGCGLLRLILGLGAIRVCRRRGVLVEDPALLGLIAELREAMGCRRAVEVRAVADLGTPATAGWWRPVLFLPGDWRSWSDAERRAVLAHELAHVVRGDYAAGLLARVAVVVHSYHPLVWWLHGRLHLEQELAADALAARFAGGRAAYLVALSSLALKQDGCFPRGPARAFLPTRGTLIRRIAMLRNESRADLAPTPQPRNWPLAAALVALAVGLATWKAPALAGDDVPPPDRPAAQVAAPVTVEASAFETSYLPDSARSLVAFRPAAIMRRPGGDQLAAPLRAQVRMIEDEIARMLHVDVTRPGFHRSNGDDIESVVIGFNIDADQAKPTNGPPKTLHRIMSGTMTVRMVAPFDWLGFFHQWRLEPAEVREGRQVYYKVSFPEDPPVVFYFHLPDDRTLVINEPTTIQQHLARATPMAPAWLRGADWQSVSQGLLAVVFDNTGNRFTRSYDRGIGDPEDAAVLGLLAGVERWVLGIPDAPTLRFQAQAASRNPFAAVAVAQTLKALVQLGQAAAARPDAMPDESARRLYQAFLANLSVDAAGGGLTVGADHFGTLGDVAEVIQAGLTAEAEAAKSSAKLPAGDGPEPKVGAGKP